MITPINNNILVQRSTPIRTGNIFIPETAVQDHFYGTIVKIGNKVKDVNSLKVGRTVIVRKGSGVKYQKNLYLVHDYEILMLVFDGVWRPFGHKVLLERRIEESISAGGILIPACYQTKDQTRECTFIKPGIINGKEVEVPLETGDTVIVTKWDMTIDEVEYNGSYGIVVPIKLLSHKEE